MPFLRRPSRLSGEFSQRLNTDRRERSRLRNRIAIQPGNDRPFTSGVPRQESARGWREFRSFRGKPLDSTRTVFFRISASGERGDDEAKRDFQSPRHIRITSTTHAQTPAAPPSSTRLRRDQKEQAKITLRWHIAAGRRGERAFLAPSRTATRAWNAAGGEERGAVSGNANDRKDAALNSQARPSATRGIPIVCPEFQEIARRNAANDALRPCNIFIGVVNAPLVSAPRALIRS